MLETLWTQKTFFHVKIKKSITQKNASPTSFCNNSDLFQVIPVLPPLKAGLVKSQLQESMVHSERKPQENLNIFLAYGSHTISDLDCGKADYE